MLVSFDGHHNDTVSLADKDSSCIGSFFNNTSAKMGAAKENSASLNINLTCFDFANPNQKSSA